jgi:hypothetical protein
MNDARERSQFVQEFLPLLSAVSDPIVRAHYLQRVSRVSMVSEEELSTILRSRGGGSVRKPETVAAKTARHNQPEEFILALLLRYPELRRDALEIDEGFMWESENRQVLAICKQNAEEDVKTGLPPELEGHFERLTSRKLPPLDLKQAREALRDATGRLQRRQIAAEKRATSALLATREEELGMPAVTQTIAQQAEGLDNEEARELAELQLRDLETGLRLHGKGSSPAA